MRRMVATLAKATADPALQRVVDAMLLGLPGVVPGRMFGCAGYFVNGRLFACIHGNGVGLRVPATLAEALLTLEHVVAFRPYDRPAMPEWIQLNRADPADHVEDAEVFRAAVEFVGQLRPGRRQRR